jgi:superoxide dismutase, Cu-Zn family
MRHLIALVASLAILLPAAADSADTARAEFVNRHGQPAGEATLVPTPNGVLIKASLTDLPPGERGFHIHEVGACDAPDFTSAGGHLEPAGKMHGYLNPEGPHAGDLPNIHVPESGTVKVDVVNPYVSLDGRRVNLLDADGSALVIHAKADDYRTDPAGDAGDRIACAVIRP